MKSATSRVRALAALAAAALALVAGCGSADGSSGSGAAGDPIKLMTWSSLANPRISAPYIRTAAEARVKAINDAGGIGGRPLELIFCDTNYDPNTEAACARQAQSEDVVAIVGAYTTFPGTVEVATRADIPMIGTFGLFPQELASPTTYPIAGGVPGWYAGALAQLKQSGARSVGLISCSSPACSYASEIVTRLAPASGLDLVGQASVPSGTPDPSAAVAQALASNPEGLVLAVPPNDMPKLVQAVRRAGYSDPIASASSLFPPATVTALGADADGILLSSQLLPLAAQQDPAVAQFVREVTAIDPQVKQSEDTEITWASYVLFEQLAKRLDTVDRASIRQAMQSLSDPIDLGLTAPYSTVGKTAPIEGADRLFNPTVYFSTIRNGAVEVISTEPVDPFELLRPGA